MKAKQTSQKETQDVVPSKKDISNLKSVAQKTQLAKKESKVQLKEEGGSKTQKSFFMEIMQVGPKNLKKVVENMFATNPSEPDAEYSREDKDDFRKLYCYILDIFGFRIWNAKLPPAESTSKLTQLLDFMCATKFENAKVQKWFKDNNDLILEASNTNALILNSNQFVFE